MTRARPRRSSRASSPCVARPYGASASATSPRASRWRRCRSASRDLYFFHRFAAFSTAKVVGGVEYHHAVAGDGQQATRPVPGVRQRTALAQLLSTLAPSELAIPDTVVTLLGPRPFGYDPNAEMFGSRTQPAFDEFGAAGSLASLVLGPLLQRDRLARLVQQSAHDPGALSLGELLASVKKSVWDTPAERSPRNAALRRAVQRVYADRLLALAADTAAAPDVRAAAQLTLATLRREAKARGVAAGASLEARAHWQALAGDIAGVGAGPPLAHRATAAAATRRSVRGGRGVLGLRGHEDLDTLPFQRDRHLTRGWLTSGCASLGPSRPPRRRRPRAARREPPRAGCAGSDGSEARGARAPPPAARAGTPRPASVRARRP